MGAAIVSWRSGSTEKSPSCNAHADVSAADPVANADAGRREYAGVAVYWGRGAVRVSNDKQRGRPQSAVARVETQAHHVAEVRRFNECAVADH